MEKRTHKHFIVVICLLLITAASLELMPEAPASVDTDLRADMPANVGRYTGGTRFFCQSPKCLFSMVFADGETPARCPKCDGPLDTASYAEKNTLPADTVMLKREYLDPNGRSVALSVVFSGTDQRSIHRPQQCLPAQGWSMERERTVNVPIPGRDPLRVRLIDVRASQNAGIEAVFAYWFVGKSRETPYHLERLFWMSADRVLRNVSQRWAYVAIMTLYTGDRERDLAALTDFISQIHPLLKK